MCVCVRVCARGGWYRGEERGTTSPLVFDPNVRPRWFLLGVCVCITNGAMRGERERGREEGKEKILLFGYIYIYNVYVCMYICVCIYIYIC